MTPSSPPVHSVPTAPNENLPLPLADVLVDEFELLVQAWEHLRLDTDEDQRLHQRLIDTCRHNVAEYRRVRHIPIVCGTCREPVARRWVHADGDGHDHPPHPTVPPESRPTSSG